MSILVKGLPGGDGYLEFSEELLDAYREEQRRERENPGEYNAPMAEFVMERVRAEKGKGYNCQHGYQHVLNGNYQFLNQKIYEIMVKELFEPKIGEECIEGGEGFDYNINISDHLPSYLVKTSQERVMRN